MLQLKLQFFGHLMRRANSLKKTLMLGGIEDKRRRGWQRMRWLDSITIQLEQLKSTDSSSIELEQIPGNSEGQGSLTCCSPLGHKESDTIQQLNTTVDLQCCISFRISGVQHSKIVFLQIILHYNLLQDNGYNSLRYTLYPGGYSILYTVVRVSLHHIPDLFQGCIPS